MKHEEAAAQPSLYDSHAGEVMDVEEDDDEHHDEDFHNVFNVKDDF